MRFKFFLKYSKSNVDLKNAQNNWEKSSSFRDKSIWICCVKLPLLRREYLSSAVNLLTNGLKIFQVTKRDSFELNYLHSDRKIWQRCCHCDGNGVLALLPSSLSRGCLKRDFLDIYLTTSFGVRNFGNT